MNMNQLIECRKSPTNIWREQCEQRIRYLIGHCELTAEFNETATIDFVPSDDVFMVELQEESNASYRTFSRGWTSSKYVQFVFNVLSMNPEGRTNSVIRFAFVRDPAVYFRILNESVVILPVFNYEWRMPPGYSIKVVKLSWHREGYNVINIV